MPQLDDDDDDATLHDDVRGKERTGVVGCWCRCSVIVEVADHCHCCGETYFMALRQRAGTGRPTPPIPAKLKEKEPKKIMLLELKDQSENGPA